MNSRASTPGMGTEGDDNEDETMLAGLHGMKDKLNAAELAALKAIVRLPQRPKQLRPVSSAACTQRWLLADRLGIFRDPPEVKASYHVSSSAPIRVIQPGNGHTPISMSSTTASTTTEPTNSATQLTKTNSPRAATLLSLIATDQRGETGGSWTSTSFKSSSDHLPWVRRSSSAAALSSASHSM